MASASRLEKLEGVIEEFQNARPKAGRALREIKERKLYEEAGYSSSGIYVQKRFGFRVRGRKWPLGPEWRQATEQGLRYPA